MSGRADPLDFLRREGLPAPAAAGGYEVNSHIHLPPNFSSFPDLDAAARQAAAENVRVLGLTSYYGTDSHAAFAEACLARGIFPLFGIELMLMDDGLARRGLRVNDPDNPGKIYLCGKGITRFPPPAAAAARFETTVKSDTERGRAMLVNVPRLAAAAGVPLDLDYDTISRGIAGRCGADPGAIVLQERHIAAAIVAALDGGSPADRRNRWIRLLGAEAGGAVDAALAAGERERQDLVRSRLLKAGRPAFVPERYLSFEEGMTLIRELGGVPVYPVLADGAKIPSDVERSPEELARHLAGWGIPGAEFIPGRNDVALVARYAEALENAGFFVTAGTEHNAPGAASLVPRARGGIPLPAETAARFRRGAACVAAHQYDCARGGSGIMGAGGLRGGEAAHLGERVIRGVMDSKIPR
ncbi:MAG: hypothetical protein V1809_16140 [Planctomycetota bacterium]